MEPLVLLTWQDQIATVTLNRPERHNSLVPEILEEFLAVLEKIETSQQASAVVVRANGKNFSTGGDMKGFVDHLADIENYSRALLGLLNRSILALQLLPIPVVTAVHGIVTGGSMGLVLSSDVVLVSPDASFTPYYSVVGFSPDGGWTSLLPRIIGASRARAVLMENLTITARQAVDWGLAQHLVPAEELESQAMDTARSIARMHPGSVRHIKRLLAYEEAIQHLEEERRRFVAQILHPDTQKSMVEFYKTM